MGSQAIVRIKVPSRSQILSQLKQGFDRLNESPIIIVERKLQTIENLNRVFCLCNKQFITISEHGRISTINMEFGQIHNSFLIQIVLDQDFILHRDFKRYFGIVFTKRINAQKIRLLTHKFGKLIRIFTFNDEQIKFHHIINITAQGILYLQYNNQIHTFSILTSKFIDTLSLDYNKYRKGIIVYSQDLQVIGLMSFNHSRQGHVTTSHTLSILNANNGQLINEIQFSSQDYERSFYDLQFSDDGKLIMVKMAAQIGRLHIEQWVEVLFIFDIQLMKLLWQIQADYIQYCQSKYYLIIKRRISKQTFTTIHNRITGSILFNLDAAHDEISCSQDGRYAISAALNRSEVIQIYKIQSEQLID